LVVVELSRQPRWKTMTEAFPKEPATKRKFLLDAVDSISKTAARLRSPQ
jgi:hypothetical protein